MYECDECVDPLNLPDFLEAYRNLDKMQLWDWLSYNGYVVVEAEGETT